MSHFPFSEVISTKTYLTLGDNQYELLQYEELKPPLSETYKILGLIKKDNDLYMIALEFKKEWEIINSTIITEEFKNQCKENILSKTKDNYDNYGC